MILHEGYFNNIQNDEDELVNDILQQSLYSAADYQLPKYQVCWKPLYNSTIQLISNNDLKRLYSLVENTRYANNCHLRISGNDLYNCNKSAFNSEDDKYKSVDFFKYYNSLDKDLLKDFDIAPKIVILHIFFDITDELKLNVKYLVKVLIELSKILKQFCIANNVPNEYISKLCFDVPLELYDSGNGYAHIRGCNNTLTGFLINVNSDLYKLSNGMTNYDLAHEFRLFWNCVFNHQDYGFNENDTIDILDSKTKCPKSLYNILINCGMTKKQLSVLLFYENKKTKCLDITIPENIIYSFKNISIKSMLLNTKLANVRLMVDGVLKIDSLSDYANLKILRGGYQHNTLIVNTIVTPLILRRLLVSYYFKKIDFTNAKVTQDIDINMQYKLIYNPDILIIPDSDNKISLI